MSAYVIVDVTVTNNEQMLKYREWSSKAMQEHGVELLARGGAIEVLEGDWAPTRIVLMKFSTMAAARAWYESETYTHARKLRADAGVVRMVIVEGVA